MAISRLQDLPGRAPAWDADRALSTDSYRFSHALVLILFVVTCDLADVLDRGNALRYLLLLLPIAWLLLVRFDSPSTLIRRTSIVDKSLGVLFLIGLAGTYYGIVRLHTETTTRPVFVPMILAFLYLGTVEPLREEEAKAVLRQVAAVGVLYILLNSFVNSGLIPPLESFKHFRNSEELYVVLGVAGAVALRRWGRMAALMVLAAFIFFTYPSLTSVLIAVGTTLTLVVTRPRGTRVAMSIAAILVVGALSVALLNFGKVVRLSDAYFTTVGKTNNNQVRLALWSPGIERFQRSPLYGSFFSAEATAPVRYRGYTFQIPFHSDYVLFLAEGGILGTALLAFWIVGTEVLVLSRIRAFRAHGDHGKAELLRALLAAFNAFFIAAGFNPNLEGAATSATVFAIYGLMMLAGAPEGTAARSVTSAPGDSRVAASLAR